MKKKKDPLSTEITKLNGVLDDLHSRILTTDIDSLESSIYHAKEVSKKVVDNVRMNTKKTMHFLDRNKESLTVGVFLGGLAAIAFKSIREAVKK